MSPRRTPSRLAPLVLALACAGEPRGPCEPEPRAGELGSVCGFENPEDVAWVPAAQLLLVSEMRHADARSGGSIAALSLGAQGEPIAAARKLWPAAQAARGNAPAAETAFGVASCTQPPPAASFAPHGIAVAPADPPGAVRVAVVGHGEREAVELFELRGAGEDASLHWTGCVPLPSHAVGNDVWLAADGVIWVTNYQPSLTGWRGLFYTIAAGLGRPTGEVLRWQPAPLGRAPGEPAAGWEAVAGTRGPNPNGLVLTPTGATLGVAFTGSGVIAIRPLAPAAGAARDVTLGGHPDNLLASSRATWLVPVHTSGLAFLRCRFGALPCTSPWKLMEVDPASGSASERFAHDGSRIGAVASVAEVGNRFYFGSVFDDRIGVWLER